MVVIQPCEYTKCHGIVHFLMAYVNFTSSFAKTRPKVSGRLNRDTDTLTGARKGNWVPRGKGARVTFHYIPYCS